MRTGIEYLSILEAICQNRYELSQSCSYEYSFETIQSRIKQLEQSSVRLETLEYYNLNYLIEIRIIFIWMLILKH